ncbi:iron transporter [Halogeometricum luteum]|uniref:Iron transporter n=1 Tax=Halogeometricum luteum TaxID=2950537 RepID=A0ABU2G819_9EURY|nr:iron transporter [Halogeometricum sp. S3BR5-2]
MKRRALITRGAGLAGGVALTGCLSRLGFETQSAWRDPPLVQDRPDAVYYPAIVEGMGMYGTTKAGDVGFALMHSFPHRFWNLTGTNKTKVVVRSSDSLHLMASVWDVETKTILPLDISVEISNTDGQVTSTNLWPMISPNMGFHYGDNVGLPGEGQYDITLRVGPLQTNRTEPLEGRFTEAQSATMSFTFDTSETYNLEYRRLGEKAGTRGTVDLMEMQMMPEPLAPRKDNLPGRLIGDGSSGDATFFVTVVEKGTRFGEDDRPYMIVSPRTPYNRVVLPRMALSATVERGQKTVFQGPLRASLDPEISCYYGTSIPGIESGDSVTITVQTPPQLARHDGYETAFLDMAPIEFTV